MALPFNLIITVIFLTLQPVTMDHVVKRDTSSLEVEGNETISGNATLMDHSHHVDADLLEADLDISWCNVGRGIVVSMGQVYAVNDVPASLVMQLAVLLSSPLLFILSNTGAVIGSLLSLTFLPTSDYQQVCHIHFKAKTFPPRCMTASGVTTVSSPWLPPPASFSHFPPNPSWLVFLMLLLLLVCRPP